MRAVMLVFKNLSYVLLTVATSVATFVFALLLPHVELLKTLLFDAQVSVGVFWSVLFSLFGTIATNFTLLGAITLFVVSILYGVVTALLVFYIRSRQSNREVAGLTSLSVLGMISAFFGIGCAACGSVILTTIIGLTASTALIGSLPFHGIEFGVIGITILSLAFWYLTRKITDPMVCEV